MKAEPPDDLDFESELKTIIGVKKYQVVSYVTMICCAAVIFTVIGMAYFVLSNRRKLSHLMTSK